MLCPQCSEKVRRREASRSSRPACLKCRYQFVFYPLEEAQITDNLFTKRLKSISPDNAYFFTVKQLYYHILRGKSQESTMPALVIGVIMGITGLIFIGFFLPAAIILLVMSALVISGSRIAYRRHRLPYNSNRFNEIVIKKWQLFKGNIEKLIPENDLSFSGAKFNDIMDYSFDALIITGDNETANFLIKNDFHFKNKTAIVSYQKYPQHLFPYVIEQIKKNPAIPVFLVHNADIIYASMKSKIARTWFDGQPVTIYDLGIHPAHVLKSKKIITQKRDNLVTSSFDLSAYLPREQKWLTSGYQAELSIIPPVKLLNVLEYAVNFFKEKGPKEMEKAVASIMLVGLGSGLTMSKEGFDLDFDMDFG